MNIQILVNALKKIGVTCDADKWITVHPNGENNTGRPALIDGETGTVKAGMGGKFNGRNIDDIPRGNSPRPVSEKKYQARQERVNQKENASEKATNETARVASIQPSQGGQTTRFSEMTQEQLVKAVKKGVSPSDSNEVKLQKLKDNAARVFSEKSEIEAQLEQKKSEINSLKKQADTLEREEKERHPHGPGHTPESDEAVKKWITAKQELQTIESKFAPFLKTEAAFRREVENIQKKILEKGNDYTGALPSGQNKLKNAYKIERETEKAYGVKVGGQMQWVPKSRSTAHEGNLVGMEDWLKSKTGLDHALNENVVFLVECLKKINLKNCKQPL